jgi:hypothetical protein
LGDLEVCAYAVKEKKGRAFPLAHICARPNCCAQFLITDFRKENPWEIGMKIRHLVPFPAKINDVSKAPTQRVLFFVSHL